jgi:hypothetical protein
MIGAGVIETMQVMTNTWFANQGDTAVKGLAAGFDAPGVFLTRHDII